MTCKECNSPDHLVKECPNRTCKNCGETGMSHLSVLWCDEFTDWCYLQDTL